MIDVLVEKYNINVTTLGIAKVFKKKPLIPG